MGEKRKRIYRADREYVCPTSDGGWQLHGRVEKDRGQVSQRLREHPGDGSRVGSRTGAVVARRQTKRSSRTKKRKDQRIPYASLGGKAELRSARKSRHGWKQDNENPIGSREGSWKFEGGKRRSIALGAAV